MWNPWAANNTIEEEVDGKKWLFFICNGLMTLDQAMLLVPYVFVVYPSLWSWGHAFVGPTRFKLARNRMIK